MIFRNQIRKLKGTRVKRKNNERILETPAWRLKHQHRAGETHGERKKKEHTEMWKARVEALMSLKPKKAAV